MKKTKKVIIVIGLVAGVTSDAVLATCPNISYADLTAALQASTSDSSSGGTLSGTNGGLDFNMWATVVGTTGEVCQVTRRDLSNTQAHGPGISQIKILLP